MDTALYEWRIIQDGELPLQADGDIVRENLHLCTTTLIWPANAPPSRTNTLLVDPCLVRDYFTATLARLTEVGASLSRIGYTFSTHDHWDHLPHLPAGEAPPVWQTFTPGCSAALAGVRLVPLPGHDPDLRAAAFNSPQGQVWVVGDAILGREWLEGWRYYWPNMYVAEEIVETWQSVARILADADIIIPGHGPAITVTPDLLQRLLARFPGAEHAAACPEVAEALKQRLARGAFAPPTSGT